MAVKRYEHEPHARGTVIPLDQNRRRSHRTSLVTRSAKPARISRTFANPLDFAGCEEPTECMLQFHPVFRYLAE